MRIVLLNLPFNRPVHRDYGCPHGSKAAYSWPPIDLLLFGASVREHAELSYLDAISGNLNARSTVDAVVALRPDAIFTMLSSITLESDREILREIRSRLPQCRIWASGDVIFFGSEDYPEVDLAVRDLTNKQGILGLLAGKGRGVVPQDPSPEDFSIGTCPHELTLRYPYALPFSLHRGITTVLTNYGCPFACTFCNSNRIPFRKRKVEEVIEELRVVRRLGIREVFIRDFTFTLSPVDRIADAMIKEGLSLKWSCFSAATLVDARLLRKMKAAGCYLICYGAESGDEAVLNRVQKASNIDTLKKAVAMTKAEGIEVLTSFIIGFPGEDRTRTASFIREIDADYLSLNLLTPRLGSAMREAAIGIEEAENTDSLLSADRELLAFRDAVERSFYLRPSKLLRYAGLFLRTPRRMAIFLRSGLAIIKRWFTRKGS
jgi:radical SAM superfamily enzyme YgiQ (UPF0313 family)